MKFPRTRNFPRGLSSKCLQRFLSTLSSLPPEMQPIIGLEIHAQLNTSPAPAKAQAPPNVLVAFHDIALPGSLPVLNKEAVYFAVKAALALGCTVNRYSTFDRKHYFYPDSPSAPTINKAYSVEPLAVDGKIGVCESDDTTGQLQKDFILPISRIQLEQDTAKAKYLDIPMNVDPKSTRTLLSGPFYKIFYDYNRVSRPLIEIVTPPVLRSPVEAATAFAKVAETLRAAQVTTGDLHLGAMRCDVNVSLGLNSARTEIKNLYGMKAIREACAIEISNQVKLWEKKKPAVSYTKTWDGTNVRILREKEGEKDYRYLPDADLPAIVLTDEFIEKTRESLPPSPEYLVSTLLDSPHNLNLAMAKRLATSPAEFSYYKSVKERSRQPINGQTICNWFIYILAPLLQRYHISLEKSPFTLDYMVDLLELLHKNRIDGEGAKLILKSYFPPDVAPNVPPSQHSLVESLAKQDSESVDLREKIVEIILTAPLEKRVRGAASVEQHYMGRLMTTMRGKVDIEIARNILKEEVKKRLILEPSPSGKVYTVRFRTEDEKEVNNKEEGDNKVIHR